MTTRFKTYFNSPIVIILFLLILVIFSTCKKYPEGGFENRGPKMLLKHDGAWKLSLYEVNGIDSTTLINYNNNEKYKEISFFNEHSDLKATLAPTFAYSVKFLDKNKNIFFSGNTQDSARYCITGSSFFGGCYRIILNPEGFPTKWQIIKLTKKEFILRTELTNNYLLKFIPR